jgi:hypothetical protein
VVTDVVQIPRHVVRVPERDGDPSGANILTSLTRESDVRERRGACRADVGQVLYGCETHASRMTLKRPQYALTVDRVVRVHPSAIESARSRARLVYEQHGVRH